MKNREHSFPSRSLGTGLTHPSAAPELPPVPSQIQVPPMPAPAEPAEPGFFDKMMDSPAFKSAMRSAGTVIGREITRSIFGTGRRRRR